MLICSSEDAILSIEAMISGYLGLGNLLSLAKLIFFSFSEALQVN